MTPVDAINVLALFALHDLQECLWWRCDGEYAPVTFFVNCNDLFFWACADAEQIELSDLPDIDRAILDAAAAVDCGHVYGLSLWPCRKRGMRPQNCCYTEHQALWPLFDACGPERPCDTTKRPEPKT